MEIAFGTAMHIGLLAAGAVLFSSASVLLSPAKAETVREQMINAAPSSRDEAFTVFLRHHGKACRVNESKFTTKLHQLGQSGDVWSVRCVDASAFAIFISDDSQSTSWFLPCEALQRRSNLRCFEAPPQQIAFK